MAAEVLPVLGTPTQQIADDLQLVLRGVGGADGAIPKVEPGNGFVKRHTFGVYVPRRIQAINPTLQCNVP